MTTWHDDAACRNYEPEMWFPAPSDFKTADAAVRICLTECPVRDQCAAFGDDQTYGIWGGITEAERSMSGRHPSCGTRAGYERHKKHKHPPCPECKQARNEAERRYRQNREGVAS